MQDVQQLEKPPAYRPAQDGPEDQAGLGMLLHATAALPRQQRRLPERILAAAHQACDIGELDAADRLLSILDAMLAPGGGAAPAAQRRVIEGMVAAYQRLWHLRCAGT